MKQLILAYLIFIVFITGCTEQTVKTEKLVETENVISTEPIVLINDGGIEISQKSDGTLIMHNELNYSISVRCEYIVIELASVEANRHYRYTRWLKTLSMYETTEITSLALGDIITISYGAQPISIFIASFGD